MSYKTILTHLDATASLTARVGLAGKLAQRHDAHLIGVAPAGFAHLPGNVYSSITVDVIASLQQEFDRQANRAIEEFESVCTEIGVNSVESRRVGNTPLDTVLVQARYCDVVIVGKADPAGESAHTGHGFVEQIVLGAGKPVIVVPGTSRLDSAGNRVLLAWDGSREAARAATDAIPILTGAQTVEVIVINADSAPGFGHGPLPGADIALYLARQGVNTEVRHLTSDIDIGNTLLSHAADTGADMMVMGGYGHSRIREWILGGATRTVLESATVPVLMSH